MAYDLNKLVTLEELRETAQVIKLDASTAFRSLKAVGNKINFYTSEDGSGDPVFSFDFPKDLFLDQLKTKFESNFTFSAEKYPGAQNPSLDGKPIFVLALKGTTDKANGTEDDTYNYSFVDMSSLVDTYEPAEGDSTKILEIAGYKIKVKISKAANNVLQVKDDGLFVDISDKADKVKGATANNLPALDVNGNITDSGIAKGNVIQKSDVATLEETQEMLAKLGYTIPAQSGD